MKRINILLTRRNLTVGLVCFLGTALGMPLFLYFLISLCGESAEGIIPTQIPVYAIFGAAILLISTRYEPLYLEYDDEKIVARYLFGSTATVLRNKTIYTAQLQMGKAGLCSIYASVPFPVTPLGYCETPTPDTIYVTYRLNRKTQIALPIDAPKEAFALFPSQMCVPAEKADWDAITQQHKDAPAAHSLSRKIRLIPGYWKEVALTLFSFLVIASMTLLAIWDDSAPVYFAIVLICYITFPWVVLTVFANKIAKSLCFLSTIAITEDTVETHWFGQTFCSVILKEPVYYAVFRGREYGTEGKPYIVISNEWFNYYKVNRTDRSYLSEYPMDTQVAFPYNAETAAICDFDNWHCVGGFGELNMKRSKTP